MAIPLVVDNAKVKALRDFARKHRFGLAIVQKMSAGKIPTPGDRPEYVLNLPFGFRVVYSVEEHPKKTGGAVWLQHLSVSLTEPTGKRVPSEGAVELLLQKFGMKPLRECGYVKFHKEWSPRYIEALCELEPS